MSAADQGAGPRSGESPASDMPAAAAFNSMEQVDQEQQYQQHKQEDASHAQGNKQNIPPVPPARPTGQQCTTLSSLVVVQHGCLAWSQAANQQQHHNGAAP